MIHRTDMVTLSLDDDEETILSAIRESGLSRFPVYQGNVDDIVGILSTRQYLLNFHVERPQELRALLRPAYFVPETVRADVLFRDMQSKKIHMAVVVDEYGGTSGLVTLEDLLEELVGNIYDEFDPQAEQEIIQLEENLWRVSGSADLEELAEAMDFQLPEDEDRDSAGGHPGGWEPPRGGGPGPAHPGGGAVRPPGGVGPGGKAGARCCRLRIETRFRTAAALPAAVLFFPPRAGRSERKELHP